MARAAFVALIAWSLRERPASACTNNIRQVEGLTRDRIVTDKFLMNLF